MGVSISISGTTPSSKGKTHSPTSPPFLGQNTPKFVTILSQIPIKIRFYDFYKALSIKKRQGLALPSLQLTTYETQSPLF